MKFSIPKLKFASRVSPREKKILVGGIIAAALFCVLYFFILPAYDAARQYPDQMAQRTRRLQKTREVIAQRQQREQSLEATRKRVADLESHLLSARTSAAAQAQLQGLVNDLAKQTQLQISRSDFGPKKELSKDYEKISVRLDAVGTINQIAAFLSAAKGMPVFVFNEDLRIVNYAGMNEDWIKKKQIAATLIVSGVMRHE